MGAYIYESPLSFLIRLRVIVYVTHIEIVVCGVPVLFLSSLSLSLSLLHGIRAKEFLARAGSCFPLLLARA